MARRSVIIVLSLVLGLTICCYSIADNHNITEANGPEAFPATKDHKSFNSRRHQVRHLDHQIGKNTKLKTDRIGSRSGEKHLTRRGLEDDLKPLKDKAKKAAAAYKWLKQNWYKLFVIVLAVFAFIVVVVCYRKCCSGSSKHYDEEPNIIVLNMPRPDDKKKQEFENLAVDGHHTQQLTNAYEKQSQPRVEQRSGQNEKAACKFTSGKTLQHGTSPAILDSDTNGQKAMSSSNSAVSTSKYGIYDVKLVPSGTAGIPLSGYTALQQIQFSEVHLDFNQYLCEVKTLANNIGARPTGVCQWNMAYGPFPLYEEIPLIRNLTASMMERCNDYIPTASTKTNLPLTVSP